MLSNIVSDYTTQSLLQIVAPTAFRARLVVKPQTGSGLRWRISCIRVTAKRIASESSIEDRCEFCDKIPCNYTNESQ